MTDSGGDGDGAEHAGDRTAPAEGADMELYAKRKIEVIVEAPAIRLILDVFDRHGASGYTVLPALSGRGHTGPWDVSPVTDARRQVMCIVVVAPPLLEPILADIRRLFEDYHGIVFVSSVDVVRSERF